MQLCTTLFISRRYPELNNNSKLSTLRNLIMDKKKILVLGAGMVVKPAVDYFLDKCNYHVIIATRTVSKAHAIIGGRENTTVIQWNATDFEKLDKLVPEADFVVNFISTLCLFGTSSFT